MEETDVQHAQTENGVTPVPWNLVVPNVDVHLVGYGNRLPNDFTLEALAVLKRCKRVFGVPPISAPDFGLPEMESLLHLYGPDKRRVQTYREMTDTVLAAAASEPPVAFATYGSAMVGTLVAHFILEEAPKRGLRVHVTNAVSCFDGMWADLNIEPFFGFEVWEANVLIKRGIEPNLRANLVIPQAPVFEIAEGPDVEKMTMQLSTTISTLRDYLLRFYPPDHTVHFVTTGAGAGPLRGPDIETLRLAELDHPGRHQGSTLFVPRLVPLERGRFDFDSPALAAAREKSAAPV
jgi:uncharacterized protein YabN with tetrapyrrole methylase and pyrophosphatase domain